jgi:hypothetical protein
MVIQTGDARAGRRLHDLLGAVASGVEVQTAHSVDWALSPRETLMSILLRDMKVLSMEDRAKELEKQGLVESAARLRRLIRKIKAG